MNLAHNLTELEFNAVSFKIEEGIATTNGAKNMEDFLSAELQHLAPWYRKIARRLRYNGPIKMVHRDRSGVIACGMDQNRIGHGTRIPFSHDSSCISDPGITHAELLSSVSVSR